MDKVDSLKKDDPFKHLSIPQSGKPLFNEQKNRRNPSVRFDFGPAPFL